MFAYLLIIWRWLLPVGRPSQAVHKPRPLRVTKFVYPTLSVCREHTPGYWSREAIERSNALDSTRPTGPMAEWLKAVHQVESQS